MKGKPGTENRAAEKPSLPVLLANQSKNVSPSLSHKFRKSKRTVVTSHNRKQNQQTQSCRAIQNFSLDGRRRKVDQKNKEWSKH